MWTVETLRRGESADGRPTHRPRKRHRPDTRGESRARYPYGLGHLDPPSQAGQWGPTTPTHSARQLHGVRPTVPAISMGPDGPQVHPTHRSSQPHGTRGSPDPDPPFQPPAWARRPDPPCQPKAQGQMANPRCRGFATSAPTLPRLSTYPLPVPLWNEPFCSVMSERTSLFQVQGGGAQMASDDRTHGA